VTSAKKVNEAPIGAQLAANRMRALMRQINPTPADTAMVVYTMSDIHAAGTWNIHDAVSSPC